MGKERKGTIFFVWTLIFLLPLLFSNLMIWFSHTIICHEYLKYYITLFAITLKKPHVLINAKRQLNCSLAHPLRYLILFRGWFPPKLLRQVSIWLPNVPPLLFYQPFLLHVSRFTNSWLLKIAVIFHTTYSGKRFVRQDWTTLVLNFFPGTNFLFLNFLCSGY